MFKNFVQYQTYKTAPIYITYDAILNSSADLTSAGNINKVDLTYSNDPNYNYQGDNSNTDIPKSDEPTGQTPEALVKTFSTKIELEKVDGASQTTKLDGVEFQIIGEKLNVALGNNECYKRDDTNGTWYMLKDGSYTETVPTNDTSAYISTTHKYKKETSSTTYSSWEKVVAYGTTDNDGKIVFSGLADGRYYIKELSTKAGYNLLTVPVVIDINGTLQNDNTMTWNYSKDGGAAGASNQFVITNNKGTTLPSTGGIGTTIFYVSGGALVLGAGILLITRKRMSMKDDK